MKFTRRKALGLLLASTVAACGGASGRSTRKRAGKVLVIGAGISGIKTARDLVEAGFQVTVIEGRDRIGGRTWTDHSLGLPLDLGASWIHGIRRNPIYALAKEQKVPLFEWDYGAQAAYGGNGRADEIAAKGEILTWKLYRRARRHVRRNPRASIQDVVDAMVDDGAIDDLSKSELDFLINLSFEIDGAADADRASAAAQFEGGEFGGAEVVFPEGYESVVRPLAQGLNVRLGESVEKIALDDAGVTVVTGKASHRADRVVVTVPLGVLKAGGIVFEPALPAAKQRAIEAMDMGVLNKTYLRFPRVFWDRQAMNLISVGERKGAWAYWLNAEVFSGEPILCGFNAASFGTALESLDDQAIVSDAMAALGGMYGSNIPAPVGHRITRWRKDPFAFGSYSYIPTEAHHGMRADLARPMADRLFFAGEATHREYPSTVHGAYLSGERAASEVIVASS